MFRFYRNAAICYAYLSDVTDLSELEKSRWFTRGWTLQELVAPKEVLFYSSTWALLGSKLEISDRISKITNIDTQVLATGAFHHVNIAGRMSWAAGRQTTRVEDLAYCLMGIFDINMPLLYGEGEKSFIRLQEEIFRVSEDPSLFAWGLPVDIRTRRNFSATQDFGDASNLHGIFANSPAAFALGQQIKLLEVWKEPIEAIATKGGVEIRVPVWESSLHLVAAMPFTLEDVHDYYLCIPLKRWGNSRVARCGDLALIPISGHSSEENSVAKTAEWRTERLHITPQIPLPKQPRAAVKHFDISGILRLKENMNYILDEVYCLSHARYSAETGEITLLEMKEGLHSVLFFKQKFKSPEISELTEINKTQIEKDMYDEGDRRYARVGFGGIRVVRVVELHSRQPRFAVLLGRNATEHEGGSKGDSWTKFIHILDEKEADDDFHSLIKRKAELARYCATRSQLITALKQQGPEKSFLSDISKNIDYRYWIEHREVHFCVTRERGIRTESTGFMPYKNVRDVFVRVGLQEEWRNFMEWKFVVSVKFYIKEDKWKTVGRRIWQRSPSSISFSY